ncbi:pyridoxal phosphate-dependent aminotransferase [Aurantibacillus circumpalustris]|uniref:pyridoxal phosphate-dependent aminotransferase n=1 Tax=Aurantibacillus circumpalustris TaxID=3036359 RepID=UPI00295A727E|nr:pyridoxal phosphate-dependent aminotransferase [Aurantibacillus circumpalustris]
MGKLSDRVNRISESQTIAMARKSRELKAQGIDIISLSLGEPDFATPQIIKDAAKKAIDDNFSYYTHVSGYVELREAICMKFKRDNGLDYTADEIVVSTGAKQSIANAVLCLVNPGDEVIIPAPFWVSYLEILKLAEGNPVIVDTTIESDFKISAQQLEKAITPKTKVIMLSTPCNPTGSVYTKQELKALAEVVVKYPELYIISDEIYEHINFIGGHQSFAQFDFIKDRIITINGVSKGFAMTGWRGGIMAAPKWIAQACDKIQGQFTSATSSITQKAMHKAMELDYPTYIEPMRNAFLKRRDLVLKLMKDIPGLKTNTPQGAFYVYPEVSYYFGKKYKDHVINNGTDLTIFLLDEGHLALVPGAAFGEDRYVRFSYATSEEKLIEALRRMKEALAKLQ